MCACLTCLVDSIGEELPNDTLYECVVSLLRSWRALLVVLTKVKVRNSSGRWAGFLLCCVVPTHSLDPCLCGEGESDHPVFGPTVSISLHLASSSITPAGSVHKSRGDSVVRMWVLQRGHSDDGCDFASTLCKYDLRKGDLFVLS